MSNDEVKISEKSVVATAVQLSTEAKDSISVEKEIEAAKIEVSEPAEKPIFWRLKKSLRKKSAGIL